MNCGEVVLASRRRETTGPVLARDRHGDVIEVETLAADETTPPAVIDPARLIDRPDDDMKLPMGKVCSDCASYRRCEWLVGALPNATSCDWSPSRFRPRRP